MEFHRTTPTLFHTVTLCTHTSQWGVCGWHLVAHRFISLISDPKEAVSEGEKGNEQSVADTANISLGFCKLSNVYMYSSVDLFYLFN